MTTLRCARFLQRTARITPVVQNAFRPALYHTSRSLRCDAPAEAEKAPVEITSPKVQEIYDQLLTLNLLETVELVNVLKDKFGYVEVAMAAPAAGGSGGAAAPVEEEKAPEKTEFTVRIDKFDSLTKIKIIKEVRTITGLGLKQAKDLVESAPNAVIKKDIPKEEAEALMASLKAVGAEVVME